MIGLAAWLPLFLQSGREKGYGVRGWGSVAAVAVVANAAVNVDLSKTFPVAGPQTDERAFEITRDLSGSAPITVTGRPSRAPTISALCRTRSLGVLASSSNGRSACATASRCASRRDCSTPHGLSPVQPSSPPITPAALQLP